MIMKVERDELVEELLKEYIKEQILGESLMRILGLDYGSKTMGVAVSDPLVLLPRVWKSSAENQKTRCARHWQESKN